MRKIQRISKTAFALRQLDQQLGLPRIYRNFNQSFHGSESGGIYKLFPFSDVAIYFSLGFPAKNCQHTSNHGNGQKNKKQ